MASALSTLLSVRRYGRRAQPGAQENGNADALAGLRSQYLG
jgi:hypothetical protein